MLDKDWRCVKAEFNSRELRVIALVTEGLKNPEIGAACGMSEHAVKNVIVSILDKTGMNSRLELALWWMGHKTEVMKTMNCLEELVLLDFNSAWREAHSRQCEWEVRTGVCDAALCGRQIDAHEYPNVRYCEKHERVCNGFGY